MLRFKDNFERSAFGVCSYLGEKLGISVSGVRMYFIYVTFVTMGSPIILYLIAAFWLNIRKYVKPTKISVWE